MTSQKTASPKTVVVTGATDGIGQQTALELARRGHRVVLHGRRAERAEAARTAIARAVPGAELEVALFDLSSLAEVKRGAAELAARFPTIDVLLENAGLFANEPTLTVDGFESSFAVNHLAHALLALELRPQLAAAKQARLVVVSSVAHGRGRLDPADARLGRETDGGYGAYARSKLANVLFAAAAASHWAADGISAFSLHPGVIGTKLLRAGFSMEGASLESGALTSLHVALTPGLEGHSGAYFSDERQAQPSPAARDATRIESFWLRTAELLKPWRS